MTSFTSEVLEAAAREKEVELTTFGRKTGKASTVTVWISTDGKRLFIRDARKHRVEGRREGRKVRRQARREARHMRRSMRVSV